MNYRHAFHAGNVADCMKHALLLLLLEHLRRKPAPFFVLDTHAGPGRTDLAGEAAQRTGEWRAGIGRLLERPPAYLEPYVALVRRLGAYPGSPLIARAMLRPDDRLACCELHPEDHAALKRLFAGDPRVAVHRRDGWEAVRGLLPPRQTRGLVIVDPPFEAAGEFDRIAAALAEGAGRFRAGVFAAWYPIKHRAPVRAFHDALAASGLRDVIAAEFLVREPLDAARLNGCGLVVVNPPFGFEETAMPVLGALLDVLGDGEPGAKTAILRLADE